MTFERQDSTALGGIKDAGANGDAVLKDGTTSAESVSTTLDETSLAETPASSTSDGDSTPVIQAGMKCGIKNVYAGKENKQGNYNWVDKLPKNLAGPVENAETAKWALIVRHVKVYNDPRRVLEIHSIVIQSPLLKTFLSKVLKGYPGVTTTLQRLQFSDKFEPLIHRWREFQEAIEHEDAATKEHAQLLNDVLTKEFKDVIDESMDMKNNHVISYELLWTLFQPGSIIYCKRHGQDCAMRLVSSQYGVFRNTPVFFLNCKYVDWDGKIYGHGKANLMIDKYSGTCPITSLSVYPLSFHKRAEDLRTRLIERGSEAEKLRGCNYKSYHGVGWVKNSWGDKEQYTIKGRIIIDTNCWNRFMANHRVYVTPFSKSEARALRTTKADEDDEEDDDGSDCDNLPDDGDYVADDGDEDDSALPQLTTEQKLICTPLLRGYSLATKQWLNFYVNSVHEVTFNTQAFDRLVLPKNQKELVLGFTETQRLTKKTTFDDVIKGKGKGIILLLSGPPGVGKTLTAESVAEEMRVPLYVMSAGDLGLDSKTVENRLTEVLEMCTKWNAVLLLDEADIFLEQRSLHELERNKLVTIFLRVLEYYEGIMFLTTNRVQTFDAAFQSRIHISLEYPELTVESRKAIWKNFLRFRNSTAKSLMSTSSSGRAEAAEEKSERHEIDDHTITEIELDRLASLELNGRQIKNVLKTSTLLAYRRQQELNYEHIINVLDVTQQLHNSTKETDRQRSAIFC